MQDIKRFNLYCDESGHLQNMSQNVMALGAMKAPTDQISRITQEIKEIKRDHGLNDHWELKWTKISKSKMHLYKRLIDYFMSEPNIQFRCVVVPDKSILKHEAFDRTHDDFYYVMFYYALRTLIDKNCTFDLYFDYKDVFQFDKLRHLKEFLKGKCYASNDNIRMHTIQSHESQLLQLTDFFLGLVAYPYKQLTTSSSKLEIVKYAEHAFGLPLKKTTPLSNQKFNVFNWTARK